MSIVKRIRFTDNSIEITLRLEPYEIENENIHERRTRNYRIIFLPWKTFRAKRFSVQLDRERKMNIGFHILIAWKIQKLFPLQLAHLLLEMPGNSDEKSLMKGRKHQEENIPFLLMPSSIVLLLARSHSWILLHLFCFEQFPQAMGFVITFPWYNW